MNLHDIIVDFLGRLLGLEQTQAIEDYQATFGANWAHSSPLWLLFGCLGLIVLALFFYFRYQQSRHGRARLTLAIFRGAVLCLLLLLLAEPILTVSVVNRKRPLLWLLFDGTDSMAICDELPTAERTAMAEMVGLKEGEEAPAKPDADAKPAPEAKPAAETKPAAAEATQPSRMDYLRAFVRKTDDSLLARLADKFRLQAFLIEGPQSARSLELFEPGKSRVDGKRLAEQLTTEGKVTAIGATLADLARRQGTANLGGVVIFSDFNENSFRPPAVQAAKRLGAEVHTVGLGATAAVDVAVEIQAPLHVQKDERTTIEVTLRQEGLDGQNAHVQIYSEALGGLQGTAAVRTSIADKTIPLAGHVQTVPIPYVPDKAGRFVLVAEVDPLPGEVVRENNRAQRDLIVLDDFLRLLYVEYEPTWEWRFVKEVFHRDKLVGLKGFRTFLHSSDPRIRRANELFVPAMTTSRKEFFSHDVIFLGDLPSSSFSPRFCEMVKEFVRDFGGGLVVVAGPRFGPGQLAETPLGDLLPVKVDPTARLDDRHPFHLRLTPMAEAYEFMQLGATPQETKQAWDNMGTLPWYQPVKRVHDLAVVLAEHPTQTCSDSKQKQPLIAVRPYGKGEVIYLGFNETWRLRRKFGEKYYRQFWGQVLEHMALSHAMALGNQKRFVVRTDRRHYQTDDTVIVTVDACSADFVPLADTDVAGRKILGELILPVDGATRQGTQPLVLTMKKKGVFETRIKAYASGEHRIRVTDPIENKSVGCTFQVTGTPVERQRAIRNVELQKALAAETGGKTYDFKEVRQLAEDLKPVARTEVSQAVIGLTNTWLSFVLVVGLLLGEWLVRKWVNLP